MLVGFGQAMTLAKWLNAIGPDNITTEAILEQMAAFEGPLILGSPVVDCGKYPEAPGNCGDHTQFYRYHRTGRSRTSAASCPRPRDGSRPSRRSR